MGLIAVTVRENGAVAYHQRLAECWEQKYRKRSYAIRKQCLEGFLADEDLTGRQWLDAGCGTGTLSRWLSKRGAIVQGVDAATDMIAIAQQTSAGCGNLCFSTVETIERLPYLSDSFDGVLCSSVIEYVQNPETALGELLRVLRPGGTLVLSVPNARSTVRTGLKLIYRMTRLFGSGRPEFLQYSRHEYGPEELSLLLNRLGFCLLGQVVFGTALPRIVQSLPRVGPLVMVKAVRNQKAC